MNTASPEYYSRRRPEILDLVPPDAQSILDCGCGEGGLGVQLRERGHRVTGIEIHTPAAEVARQGLDRVLVGDLNERLDDLQDERFDCIVCADILEHVPDPWGTVRRLVDRLRPGGTVVCSVPNVRHLGVLVDLIVRGRWRYGDSGILDRTHLRFFTRIELLHLLEQAGLDIEQIRANREAFRGPLRLAATAVSVFSSEFGVAQWLVRARRHQG